jgi:hypothetical protein
MSEVNDTYAALFRRDSFSVSRIAEKINEEFEIGCDEELISSENLALLVAELASERISSSTALITLNQLPIDDPQQARSRIDELSFERFTQLLKISSRTKESNTARAKPIPDYVEFALYVAHIRLLERDGKNPGWRKLKKRASDILGRSTQKRDEWIKFVTKSRIEKLLPTFRAITQKPDYPSPEYVVWVTEFNWLA